MDSWTLGAARTVAGVLTILGLWAGYTIGVGWALEPLARPAPLPPPPMPVRRAVHARCSPGYVQGTVTCRGSLFQVGPGGRLSPMGGLRNKTRPRVPRN